MYNSWIRTSKPNKYDKIPLSIFNFNLEDHQKTCNGAWYFYNNVWIPTLWIIDHYQLTYIQLDVNGNEISRCKTCNNYECSNSYHNIYWQNLKTIHIQELYQEIERLNYIIIQQSEEIDKLRKETFEDVPNIISSVIKNVID